MRKGNWQEKTIYNQSQKQEETSRYFKVLNDPLQDVFGFGRNR